MWHDTLYRLLAECGLHPSRMALVRQRQVSTGGSPVLAVDLDAAEALIGVRDRRTVRMFEWARSEGVCGVALLYRLRKAALKPQSAGQVRYPIELLAEVDKARGGAAPAGPWVDLWRAVLAVPDLPCAPWVVALAARDLALGRDTTCGLFADGTARCLGANGSGQLGRGSASSGGVRAELMAAPVAGLTNIQALALGEDHACAYTADGATRCWGANAFAQLGIGVEGDAQYAPYAVDVATTAHVKLNAAGFAYFTKHTDASGSATGTGEIVLECTEGVGGVPITISSGVALS